jgi:hypothetical protein
VTAAAASKPQSLAQRFSKAAKRVVTAVTVRTNGEVSARQEQKTIDKLVAAAAATTAMSERTRRALHDAPEGANSFFIAPLDPETGKEDFSLYDPAADIDSVYQQLAHGVQLSHFEVPLDIAVTYDSSGLLVAKPV